MTETAFSVFHWSTLTFVHLCVLFVVGCFFTIYRYPAIPTRAPLFFLLTVKRTPSRSYVYGTVCLAKSGTGVRRIGANVRLIL